MHLFNLEKLQGNSEGQEEMAVNDRDDCKQPLLNAEGNDKPLLKMTTAF